MLKPLNDVLVVERIHGERKTKAGIHLPKDHPNRAYVGKVLAVGTGTVDEKGNTKVAGVEVGQKIAYLRSHGKDFKVEGEVYHLVKASGVLGVVKE